MTSIRNQLTTRPKHWIMHKGTLLYGTMISANEWHAGQQLIALDSAVRWELISNNETFLVFEEDII